MYESPIESKAFDEAHADKYMSRCVTPVGGSALWLAMSNRDDL